MFYYYDEYLIGDRIIKNKLTMFSKVIRVKS